jgi:uncharacterized protein YdhG (YjbR/CyaY superfamily)
MRNYLAKSIDDFIENAPEESRKNLKDLNSVFKEMFPDAEQVIAWGIPFYKKNGYIVGFTNLNGYVSFGFTNPISDDVKKEFEKNGYKTTMKTIKIYFNQEVPKELIKKTLK